MHRCNWLCPRKGGCVIAGCVSDTRPIDRFRKFLREFVPGLTVLVVVLILLRGVGGTVDAMRLQLITLANSFLGTGDGLAPVLLLTLPLALSAGVCTFLIARSVLTFESFGSVVGMAVIILAGASTGGVLIDLLPAPSDVDPQIYDVALSPLREAANKPAGNQQSPITLSIGSPLRSPSAGRLNTIDWWAEPDISRIPLGTVEPLHMIPEPNGVLGLVVQALNQLMGYLVAYQPRLFLAAIVAGSWSGWTLHRKLKGFSEQKTAGK